MLTGCGVQETFETVDDLYVVPASVAMGRLSLSLPEETTMQVMALSDENRLYFCDGYTLVVQTMESGNLEETFRQTTGFSKEELIPIKTNHYGADRYDCVWMAAGEAGDQICRAAILDDGNYHYCVTVMAPANTAGELTETWNDLLNTLSIIRID